MKYLDCVSIGSIGYDLVDLNNVENEFKQKHTLIYEPTTTPMLEAYLVSKMPDKWMQMWNLIHPIQFKDPISLNVKQIWNQHLLEHDNFQNLNVYLNRVNIMDNELDYSSWDEANDDNFDERITNMRNKTKKQILQAMQNAN